jgi:hypothetical protein
MLDMNVHFAKSALVDGMMSYLLAPTDLMDPDEL